MVVTAPPPLQDADQAVEGGVIEDARERQRRHRRCGSALIAAALATGLLIVGLVGGGGGPGASRRPHHHPASAVPGPHHGSPRTALTAPAAPGIAEFGLLAPRVGWIADGSRLFLTRNGGRSWRHLSLGVVGEANANRSSSPSPSQLVLSATDGSARIVLTTNAGRRWSARAFAPQTSPAALSFLNRRLGFALAYKPAAHHDPRASLYETRDGAHTWTRIARVPFQGLISFANARDGLGGGWALNAGLVDGGAIYRTSNGGRSWTRTSLCGPAVACEAPRLFPSGRGVVLTTASSQQTGSSRVAVYTTRDNGVSWTRHILPNTPRIADASAYIPFSAPSANDLFAWVSPYLYASTDGGKRWSRSAAPELNPPGLQPGFGDIAFANRSYGWYADGSVFAYTTDAGSHWTRFGHAG